MYGNGMDPINSYYTLALYFQRDGIYVVTWTIATQKIGHILQRSAIKISNIMKDWPITLRKRK
jgi:hypothetical protein